MSQNIILEVLQVIVCTFDPFTHNFIFNDDVTMKALISLII